MATIDLGKIKQVWRGTYNNGTAYTVDDLVAYTDSGILSTYICVANSTGNAPSSSGTAHASWNYVSKGSVDPIPSQSGNSGKALVTNGSAVSWGTAGKVLQVVQEYNTSFVRLATSSTSFVASDFKVTITPTVASSKILIDFRFISNNNAAPGDLYIAVRRSINGGSFDEFTPFGSGVGAGSRYITRNYGGGSRNEISTSFQYLDSPSYSLGQAIEYKLYGATGNGSNSVEIPSSPNRTPVLCFATEIAA